MTLLENGVSSKPGETGRVTVPQGVAARRLTPENEKKSLPVLVPPGIVIFSVSGVKPHFTHTLMTSELSCWEFELVDNC